MVQNYTKSDSWSQNLLEKFGQLQTSSGKSKKLKFYGLFLSKKYTLSDKTYTEGYYSQLFLWKFTKFLMSFLKP